MKKIVVAAIIFVQILFAVSVKAIAVQPFMQSEIPLVVVDVTTDRAQNDEICKRVLNGEVFEGIVYNCNAMPAFQTNCDDPERSTADCPGAVPQVVVPVDQELP